MKLDPRVVNGVLAKAKLVMTEYQYAIFESKYGDDMSVAAIAEAFECSESAVYKVLQRAKKQMKLNWR